MQWVDVLGRQVRSTSVGQASLEAPDGILEQLVQLRLLAAETRTLQWPHDQVEQLSEQQLRAAVVSEHRFLEGCVWRAPVAAPDALKES